MYDKVDCPYCGYTNDMTDVSYEGMDDDNTLDWECQECEEEFEVCVEFEPVFSASKIEYIECDICGDSVRDIYDNRRIIPFPKELEDKKVCRPCWSKHMYREMNKTGDEL